MNDYDFGYEGYLPFIRVLLHKGHIRKHNLGYNNECKEVCKKFAEKRRGKKVNGKR